jgi:hypothetical protein
LFSFTAFSVTLSSAVNVLTIHDFISRCFTRQLPAHTFCHLQQLPCINRRTCSPASSTAVNSNTIGS